ncbi:MAG: transglutaminase domain-containing protein [Ruminococcaceae bacterium]|nr:transglutaminase domain-containing protein [Oscillospiraceae bacterium]
MVRDGNPKTLRQVLSFAVGMIVVFLCATACVSDVYDISPPIIEINGGSDRISAYVGQGVAYREYLNVFDDHSAKGQISVKIDTSKTNIYKPGIYTVRVIATDKHRNTRIRDIALELTLPRISEDELFSEIARISEQIITSEMDTEEKCRSIYKYIRGAIEYCDNGEFSEWREAAYYGLINLRGDCFTYCSVAEAFFEYFGIEYLTIKRSEGKTADTHFWNMVNIGTAQQPKWYHFDCTRLLPDLYMMGCLMTDAQLELYNQFRAECTGKKEDRYFYLYDREKFPKVSDEKITHISINR